MTVSRRGFVGGAVALGALGAFGVSRPMPRLRFGVMSDVHVGGKPDAVARAERVLRWFASKEVDAVLCPGDIAHSGNIRELEAFADAWRRVFSERGRKGRPVRFAVTPRDCFGLCGRPLVGSLGRWF